MYTFLLNFQQTLFLKYNVKFEIITKVKILILGLRIMTPCGLVRTCQRFGKT